MTVLLAENLDPRNAYSERLLIALDALKWVRSLKRANTRVGWRLVKFARRGIWAHACARFALPVPLASYFWAAARTPSTRSRAPGGIGAEM